MPENKRGTILVVDDDPDIRDLMTSRLLKMDVDVDQAVDYVSAVAQLKESAYDLILCDFNIGHGGRRGHKHGGHILDYVTKNEIESPFYFISGLLSMASPEKQEQYTKEATGFVEKPISRTELRQLVDQHLPT